MMTELFKKRLPDDVVHYFLYLNNTTSNLDQLEKKLEDYLDKCLALVLHETCGYIWQNQSFNLQLHKNEELLCLFGSTKYGDSLADEWFIVYLIQKITKVYPELIASVTDSDGEFLLIESAKFLPKWLTPDTSENRVFITYGSVHILTIPSTPAHVVYSPVGKLTLQRALNIIAQYPQHTQAISEILECIQKRIDGFPQKALDSNHFSNVFIPRNLVHLLDQHPNFISECVNAFYLRDPIDLRSCRQFLYMLPEDRVWTNIPMARQHYAQLVQQHFIPDKRSGYQISKKMKPSEEKGVDLGLKIAHGCEIICAKAQKNFQFDNNCDENNTNFNKEKFELFVSTLTETGFFRGEMEGSKLYQELINQAQKYYLETSEQNKDTNFNTSHNMFKLLLTWKNQQTLPELQTLAIASPNNLPSESCDKWLTLDESDVDEIAKTISDGFSSLHSKQKGSGMDEQDADKNEELQDTVSKVNTFVDKISDYSGIEVDDTEPLTFDTNTFLESLQSMLSLDGVKVSTSSLPSEDDLSDFLSSEDSDEDLFETSSTKRDIEMEKMTEYMKQMDIELSSTAVGKSFVKENEVYNTKDNGALLENEENPVDVDVNLLENFLQGSRDERAASGPITNILSSIGANLPS